MNADDKRRIDTANKRMQRLEAAGIDNMILRETKNALLNFYLDNDVVAPSSGRFTKKTLSAEKESELLNIVDMFMNAKSSKKGYYTKHGNDGSTERSFETFKTKYPNVASNYQEWVDYIDDLDNIPKGFKEYYDSSTLTAIYDYGYSIGLSTEEIQKNIKKQLRYGKKTPHESRYDKTIARINKYYDKKKG